MNKRLTYLLVFFLLMGAILYFTSDRIVSLGIVSSLETTNTVEVIVDGKFYKKLDLEPSMIPLEFIHMDLSHGYHTILIRSHSCDLNSVFEVFNVVGYNINVAYYENQAKQCDSYSRESYFSLVHM